MSTVTLSKGNNPKVLIISGTHGDEADVIESIQKIMFVLREQMVDFFYIPELSPSAVKLKTRENEEGVDLNRSFMDDSSSFEAQQVMDLIREMRFDLCVNFHEDIDREEFYSYETGKPNTDYWEPLKEDLQKAGVSMYSGLDDPELGHEVIEGLCQIDYDEDEDFVGPFTRWAYKQGICSRFITPEIPGKAIQAKKDEIVKIIVRHLFVEQEK